MPPTPNDPVLIAYTVKPRKGGAGSHWTKIGAAYPHETGAGLTVILDALPFDNRIVLLEPTDPAYSDTTQLPAARSQPPSLLRTPRRVRG